MNLDQADKDVNSRNAARKYVRDRLARPGGLAEAWLGFRLKTLPIILGTPKGLSAARLISLLLRTIHLVAVALFPIFIRKAIVSAPASANAAGGTASMVDILGKLDATDATIGAIAIGLSLIPKLIEVFGRRGKVESPSPYYNLAAAIDRAPCQMSAQNVDDAIQLALEALRQELSEFVGDERGARLTDITLLEFCDAAGSRMQVRVRTANHEPTGRPVASEKFLAYFVAMEGRWFVEHDFLAQRHPFSINRLTVIGLQKVNYRSVLYLPIMLGERNLSEELPFGQHGAVQGKIVDKCLGVICVHCAKPYRFWRWGDHGKASGSFGNVAYERSMPYISLITKLLEPAAHRVVAKEVA